MENSLLPLVVDVSRLDLDSSSGPLIHPPLHPSVPQWKQSCCESIASPMCKHLSCIAFSVSSARGVLMVNQSWRIFCQVLS